MTLAELSIAAFAQGVASSEVTPSGGASAAICGAIGAALCEMACRHTVEYHEPTPEVEGELSRLGRELHEERGRLLALAEEDAAAVDDLLDGVDDTSSEARHEPIIRVGEVPLEIAEACLAVVERAATVVDDAHRNAVPDAATGAFLAHGAVEAGVAIGRANRSLLEDEAPAEGPELKGRRTTADAGRALDRVRRVLNDGL